MPRLARGGGAGVGTSRGVRSPAAGWGTHRRVGVGCAHKTCSAERHIVDMYGRHRARKPPLRLLLVLDLLDIRRAFCCAALVWKRVRKGMASSGVGDCAGQHACRWRCGAPAAAGIAAAISAAEKCCCCRCASPASAALVLCPGIFGTHSKMALVHDTAGEVTLCRGAGCPASLPTCTHARSSIALHTCLGRGRDSAGDSTCWAMQAPASMFGAIRACLQLTHQHTHVGGLHCVHCTLDAGRWSGVPPYGPCTFRRTRRLPGLACAPRCGEWKHRVLGLPCCVLVHVGAGSMAAAMPRACRPLGSRRAGGHARY